MVTRVAFAALWLAVIGLACVYLELARIRIGHRIHRNLEAIDVLEERIRLRELEYNRLAAPDVLESEVEEFIGGGEGDAHSGV